MKMHRVLATLVAMSILAAMPMTVHAEENTPDGYTVEAEKKTVIEESVISNTPGENTINMTSGSSVEVQGDVRNKSDTRETAAIAASNVEKQCNITVDGVVAAEGYGIHGSHIDATIKNKLAESTAVNAKESGIDVSEGSHITVNGNVKGDTAIELNKASSVTVNGDVIGKQYGIVLDGSNNKVYVSGSVMIKGTEAKYSHGIIVLKNADGIYSTTENNDITVWRIGDGTKESTEDALLGLNNRKTGVGSGIKYIVRTATLEDGTITLDKAAAKENEVVTATVTKAGYRLTGGTLQGTNITELEPKGDGTFCFTVNRFGGASITITDLTWEEVQEIIRHPEKVDEYVEDHKEEEETPAVQPASNENQVTQHSTDAAEIPANGGQVTITVGGNQIDINTANVKTEAPAKAFVSAPPTTDQIGQNLTTFAQTLQAGQCLSMTKYQLFVGGKPLEGKVGTIAVQMHVTSAQEGQEVLVVIWGPDGGIRYEKVKVVNGVVPVELSEYSYVAVYTLQ